MGTSTLVQDLTTGRGVGVSARREIQTFHAHAAIAVGDFVALRSAASPDGDIALKVQKAIVPSAGAIGPLACIVGVALTAAAAGESVNVCLSGVCEANVDGGTAIGSLLCAGATAGRADVYEAAFLNIPVAMAVEADTSNVATVIMLKQF